VPPYGQTVLRDLGAVLHVPGAMALVSLPLAWLFDEAYATLPLVITAAASLVPGQVLYRRYRHAESMRLRQAMVTVVLSWAFVPLIGLLPLLLIARHLAGQPGAPEAVLVFGNFWNAAFEAMSGFTSTGLTMTARTSALPHCLQWWRSFMQWVGGVGVIVLMLSVFHPSGDAERLYFSEGRSEGPLPGIASSVRTTWWIYLLYTALAIVLLRLAGMDWWQAVNYGMTGIATGGFGITDNSMADFGAGPRLAMIVIMLTGAISFATHYRMLTTGRISELWRSAEYRVMLVLLIGGTLALGAENRWYGSPGGWLDDLFQWTSALATAGFSTLALQDWSPTALVLLSLAMMCGGAAGSTTGGLKLTRVVLLAQGAYARVRGAALHPWRLMEHKPMADAAAEHHARRMLEAATIMATLWAISPLAGTILLLHATAGRVDLSLVVAEVASALGNVGLSTGITDPGLPWFGKLGLITLMWLGRLEIVPVLVVVAALMMGLRPRHHHTD
jgi:trk system potassium uptake protein TrkH